MRELPPDAGERSVAVSSLLELMSQHSCEHVAIPERRHLCRATRRRRASSRSRRGVCATNSNMPKARASGWRDLGGQPHHFAAVRQVRRLLGQIGALDQIFDKPTYGIEIEGVASRLEIL